MKNTQSASATSGWLPQRLASALLVLGLSVGTIAMTATPVEAATVVLTCFTPVYGNFLARGLPVKLQALTSSGYKTILTATLDNGGCAWWGVPAAYHGSYLRTSIEFNNYYFQYWGASAGNALASDPSQQWLTVPSNGHAYPGDDSRIWVLYGVVTCYGCKL